MTLTLLQAIAEFKRAGLPVDQDNDALCPVCRRMLTIRDIDGTVELECSEGCSREDIANALHILSAGNPDLPPDAPEASSWEPVDLMPFLTGQHEPETPSVLHRTDGTAVLYRGRLHAVYGEPEACKGWLALAATVECMEAGEPVVYLDYEDTAANIVARLVALGVDKAVIRARLTYLRIDEPVAGWALEPLVACGPGVVVIDGITEALTVEGLDMAANQDIAEFRKRLSRSFVRSGAAVLEIDHVVKDKDSRGRYAIGAQHKLAGVDVAYRLDVAQPFGREREGLVKVTVTKDRPGYVRQHSEDGERAGLLRLRSDNGTVTATLEPAEDHADGFRPTTIMERVSRVLEAEPGLTRNAVRSTVKGRAAYVDLALELLVSEGFVKVERDGQAKRHHPSKPYRNQPGPTGSQPGPGPSASNRVPGSPSLIGDPDPDSPNGTANGSATESRAERLLADHPDLAGRHAA